MWKSKLFDGDAAQYEEAKRINVGRRMLSRWTATGERRNSRIGEISTPNTIDLSKLYTKPSPSTLVSYIWSTCKSHDINFFPTST
jgi:hypothetical protein